MAVVSIRLKRGSELRLPKLGAPSGEPYYCEDTKRLFIGTGVKTEAEYAAGAQIWARFEQITSDTVPNHFHTIDDIIESSSEVFLVTANEKSALFGIDYNIKEKIDALSSGIVWQDSVATYADIATTYTAPLAGWAVIVEANETKSGQRSLYIYDGTTWNYQGGFNISASALLSDTAAADKTYSSNKIDALLADKSDATHNHDAAYAKISDLAAKADIFDQSLLHDKSVLGSMAVDETNKGEGRALVYDYTANALKFVDITLSGGDYATKTDLLLKSDVTHIHNEYVNQTQLTATTADYYNKADVETKLNVINTNISRINKEVVFVIPRVNATAPKPEIIVPYVGTVKQIVANLPTGSVVTTPLNITVEQQINGSWVTIDTLGINAGALMITKNTAAGVAIDNSRIRIRIATTQTNLLDLVVMVVVAING